MLFSFFAFLLWPVASIHSLSHKFFHSFILRFLRLSLCYVCSFLVSLLPSPFFFPPEILRPEDIFRMPSGTSVLSRPILTRYFIRRALFEVQCAPGKRKGDGVQRNRTPREKPASLRTNRPHNKRERFLGPVNDSGPENVTPAFAIKSNCLHEVERGRLILNSSETVFPQVPVRVSCWLMCANIWDLRRTSSSVYTCF